MPAWLLILFVAVICILAYVWRTMRNSTQLKLPPVYPGAWPVVGHALMLLGDSVYLHNLVKNISKASIQCGGVLLCYIGNRKYYVITDPDDYHIAANQCLQKHYFYYFIKTWLGDGLLTGPDLSIWRRHRKLLSPVFNQNIVEAFLTLFNQHSRAVVEELSEQVGQGLFCHIFYMYKYSLESVCSSAVGFKNKNDILDVKRYLEAVQQIFHIATLRFQNFLMHSNILYNWTKLKKEEDKSAQVLLDIYNTSFQKKRQNRDLVTPQATPDQPKPFIDLILELSKDDALSDKEISEELNTIILAGHETTGNALTYTLTLLGSNPKIQEKAYRELLEVFGDSNRDVEKRDLAKLVYLEAILKESLRLYTITPVMLRHVDRDVKLKNYTMPAGSSCLLFTNGLHRHPLWGPDVDEFNPERWLTPAFKAAKANDVINKIYTPFGVGRRLCLGQTYAMISMKTIMCHLLRRYRFCSDVTNIKLKIDPLLKPVSGHEISIELRKIE